MTELAAAERMALSMMLARGLAKEPGVAIDGEFSFRREDLAGESVGLQAGVESEDNFADQLLELQRLACHAITCQLGVSEAAQILDQRNQST